MNQKTILHMDGDAFFVGVEVAKNEALRGLPVVTGEERGIVSALSYEAKALGVVRGMPIFRVLKEFPRVIVLPGDYASYARYSSLMFDIVRRYADEVEEYSIDECFADLTGLSLPLKMSEREIAEEIKREVEDELRLSVTIGLAPTKVLAKVASKWVKPNGLTVITEETAQKFLKSTPIEKVWGIGPRTGAFLQGKGISSALDFAMRNKEWVNENLSKPYVTIWSELNCVFVSPVDATKKTSYASIQKTQTFHPGTNDKSFLLSQLSKHIEDACRKARRYHLAPKKVSLFLKTQGFKYTTCDIVLSIPTNAPETIVAHLLKRFSEIHTRGVVYRATGVTLFDLTHAGATQGDLFGESEKTEKLGLIYKRIDALEEKHGKRLVYLASTDNALKHKRRGTDFDDAGRDLLFL
jgi:DNA polymerase-4/DNA polymerase V